MKRLFCLLLVLIVGLSASFPAYADGPDATLGSDHETIELQSGEPTRAEETMWYYRVLNGIAQMRLWSITYGKWLTPWIDIGPVNP